MTKALKILALPIILLAVMAVFWGVLPSGYHLDDFETLVNHDLADAPFLPLISQYPTRWLVFLTYWLNLRPGMTDFLARFFASGTVKLVSLHGFNLAIHAINAWLVYLITLPLILPLRLRDKSHLATPGHHLAALAVALLFALHPLQTQPVIYLSQRFTLLSAFFYFSALYFTTRAYFYGWRKPLAISLAALCCLLGLFCKETVVTAPISCLALLWLFEASPSLKYWRRKDRKNLGLWLAGAIILAIILPILVFCQLNHWNIELIEKSFQAVGGTGTVDINVEGLNRWTYFLTQPYVMLFYLALFIWPGMLCVDHDIPLCTTPFCWQFLLPAALLLFCIFAGLKYRHKRPLLAFGLFFFVFPLLPQSSIMPTLDLSFEHRMYLSVAGLIWLFSDVCAILAEMLPKAFTYALRSGVPLLIVLYALASVQRSKVWDTELTLWADAMKKAPNKQRVVTNFASAYLEATGDATNTLNLIDSHLDSWHKIHPRVFALRGSAFQRLGRINDAIESYKLAVNMERSNVIFRYNLAMLLYMNGLQGQSLTELDKLIKLDSSYADAYFLKGVVELKLNRKKEAMKDLGIYLERAPHGENVEAARSLIDKIRNPKPKESQK